MIIGRDIKGIVFDKDGTLFDFHAVWSVWCDRIIGDLASGNEVLADQLASAIGYNRERRTFTAESLIVSGTAEDSAGALCQHLQGSDIDAVTAVCNRHLNGLPIVPVNNLESTLDQLKSSGLKLGVATNDSEASALAQLKDSGVERYFNFVYGYDSGYGGKPGAGMLHAFSNAAGISPKELMMVGDSLHDINAGIAAGVGLTVGVLTGPATEADLAAHANLVMADINGLVELL